MKEYVIEIKWALIYALMFLIWMTFEKLAGLHDTRLGQQQFVTILIFIPSIIIYVLALKDKKANFYAGTINYIQSFQTGLILTLFIVILNPLNQLITLYYISPNFFSNVIAYNVKTGMLTPLQAEQQFNIGNYLITSVVKAFTAGTLFNIILSHFVKSPIVAERVRKRR